MMFIAVTRKIEALPAAKQPERWNKMLLNPRAIISITTHPDTGETWVDTGGVSHIVKESVEQVSKMVEHSVIDLWSKE